MNTESALSHYIMQAVDCVQGSKVLYLDVETRGIISQLLSQTEALSHNIFLIHQLGVPIKNEKTHANLAHLSAVILVRPTADNVNEIIKNHLQSPKHSNYYLFFTNQLEEHELNRMAKEDENEVVQTVMEYFADYYPITRDLWSLQLPNQMALYDDEKAWSTDTHNSLDRQLDGLSAFLLSVKKRPVIRYAKSSNLSHKMAKSIYDLIENEKQLFGWSQPQIPPLLLIVDRKDDPITPLLSQWTYLAMVHELLTINNSRVDMRHTDPKNKEMQELVLNAFDKQHDFFFNKHMNDTFGDLGVAVKKMVDSHTASMKEKKNMKSVQDMQKFVENYGKFLSDSGMVSKHVAILTELSNLVNKKKLLDISSIEQEIVCGNAAKEHFKEVEIQIRNPNIPDWDKLRLSILYCLRYETTNETNISKIKSTLRDNVSSEEFKTNVELINIILRKFGSKQRTVALFEEEEKGNFLQKIKRSVTNVQGVENIYTQHDPLLYKILDKAIKRKLEFTEYPVYGNASWSHQDQPAEIIVYVMGGATYEEALTVTKFNEKHKDVRIVLGSGFIHNSKSFLNDIKNTFLPKF